MNKGSSKIWWVAGIIVVIVLVYLGVSGGLFGGKQSPTAGQTVKIGVVTALSGDAAAYGQEMEKIISYREQQINDAGGINGTKFQFVFEDGKCTGADAVDAFQKLVNVDGVKIILGGSCSAETLGMAPLADQDQVLLFSALSSNPKIEGIGKYTLSLSYSDSKIATDLAKEMQGYKRIAIISEQNDYNVGVHDTFVSQLKNYPSATIVADETFPKGSNDFRSILQKVKGTDPDAILLNPNVGPTAQNLLKQLAEIKDWTGYKLYSQYAYLTDASRADVGSFADGMVVIDAPSVNSPELLAQKDAIVKAEGGTLDDLGNYYTASTLDAVNLLTTLIAKDGNDPTKVLGDLSTGAFSGYIGPISFNGHNFVNVTLVGKYVIENGKAVLQGQ